MPSIVTGNPKGARSAPDDRLRYAWNPETREFLHMSGTGTTDSINLAWFGYRYQYEEICRRDPEIAGFRLYRKGTIFPPKRRLIQTRCAADE